MLNIARPLQQHFSAWCPAFFAIWFHDAVQGRGNNNELESAQLAQQALTQLGAPASVAKHTYQMILASETHDAPKDNDSALFIDCDLSILGSPTRAYQHYAQQCRKEYPVPDCLYRMGRRRFLNTLLARESIYQTPLAKCRLEKQARHNINMELATLGTTR